MGSSISKRKYHDTCGRLRRLRRIGAVSESMHLAAHIQPASSAQEVCGMRRNRDWSLSVYVGDETLYCGVFISSSSVTYK